MPRKKVLAVWAIESPKYSRRFKLVWNDPITGKRRQRKSDHNTRRLAEREAADLEKQLKAGKECGCPWSIFRSQYEFEYLPLTSEKNVYKWRSVARKFEAFTAERGLKTLLLSDVTAELMAGFESSLRREMANGSIKSTLGTLRSGLSWAAELGYMPPLPKPHRRARTVQNEKEMHGRPITDREFATMLKACDMCQQPDDWRFILRLIYWGGFRAGEVFRLHWTNREQHRPVDLHTDSPKWAFRSTQKNRRDQLVAMAPVAARLLRRRTDRDGWVCWPVGKLGFRYEYETTVGKTICEIGRASGVVTDPTGSKEGGPQYVTAHDLRRSFCHYWAQRVQPAVLMHLARHSRIETTLKYYVGSNADSFAGAIANGCAVNRKQAKPAL